MKIMTKNRAYLITACLSIALVFSASNIWASSNQNDLDIDGYMGQQVGGDDCVDSLQSSYITATANCNAAATPTFLESKSDPDIDDDIADHSWIKDAAGLYHLYFQNEDAGAGNYIEHYTSSNLQNLSYIGSALLPDSVAWDSYGLWAPHVVEHNGIYYMFYAGVTGSGGNPNAVQRIGLATSSDLVNWTKQAVNNCEGTTGAGCVYDCSEAWTRWGLGGAYDSQCRDPFVIRDQANNRWLMFVTTLSNVGGPWGQVISVAESNNLLDWTGLGYIKNTKRLWPSEGGIGLQLSGGIAENPYLTEYDGNYYLFFTDYNDPEDPYTASNPRTQIQYVSSPTLAIDNLGSETWVYNGSIPDPGVNAMEVLVAEGDTWIMSQSVVNGNSGDWPMHSRDLRLKRMVWNEDGTFSSSKLTKLSCRIPSGDINPGASEICGDTFDNDCNGEVDDAMICGVCIDVDIDGYGSSGILQCVHQSVDCNDNDYFINPGAAEYCGDSIDNNCNGQIDELGCTVICIDNDEDGFGSAGFEACENIDTDCNDNNALINPNALEICDRLDNDCDSRIDEGGVCPRPKKIKWELCEESPDAFSGGACYLIY